MDSYICPICNSDVPIQNEQLHQLRCGDSNQLQQYQQTNVVFNQNQEQVCQFCYNKIKNSEFQNHINECKNKKVECSYCLKEIYLKDFELHMPLCKIRNHKSYQCSICKANFKYEHQLEQHKNINCQAKIKECQYCQIHLLLNEKDHHELYCGSKTTACSFCSKTVLVKDKQQHELECFRQQNNLITQKPVVEQNFDQKQPENYLVYQDFDIDDLDQYLESQNNDDDENEDADNS